MENNCENRIATIILAAGKSTRMGEFKPLLKIESMTAVEREVKAFQEVGVKNITLITGHLKESLEIAVRDMDISTVFNEHFEEGMFTSIQKGLNELKYKEIEFTGVFIMPVDCPIIPIWVIREMINLHKENQNKMIVPCFRGKKGHPLLLPWSYADEIIEYKGKGGLKALTEKYEDDLIRLETNTEAVILDMDTKEGYEEILRFQAKDEKLSIKDILKNKGIKRVIMIRHGQPVQHKSKILLGQTDIPLSEKGKDEALKAEESLQELQPKTEVFYTSDLKRAYKTAEIIKGENNNAVKICKMPDLREINLGSWDGRLIADIKKEFPKDFEKRGQNLMTFKRGHSSENFYDMQYRVMKAIEKIAETHKDEDLVIVSHSGVMGIIYSNLMEIPLEEALNIKIDTGEIIELFLYRGEPMCSPE